MSDADRIVSFIALAEEDLRAARLLRTSVPRQAAFFVQQTVEKIGKALLVHDGVDPERIHAIAKLAAELTAAHPLRADLMALDRLSIYATATRYPSPTGKLPNPPAVDALDADIATVADLLARAKSHVGLG